ncbi:MAG: hypothetical protein Q9217_006173 [Psora testacea]
MGNSSSKHDLTEFTHRNPNAHKPPRMAAPRQYKPNKVLGENVSNQYATEYYHDRPLPPAPLRLPPAHERKYESNSKPAQYLHPCLPKSGKRWRDPSLVTRTRKGDHVHDDYHAQLKGGYQAFSRSSAAEIWEKKLFQPPHPALPAKHLIPRKPVGEGSKPRKPQVERKGKPYSLFPSTVPTPPPATSSSTSHTNNKNKDKDNKKKKQAEEGAVAEWPRTPYPCAPGPLKKPNGFAAAAGRLSPPRHPSRYVNRQLPFPPTGKGKGKQSEYSLLLAPLSDIGKNYELHNATSRDARKEWL